MNPSILCHLVHTLSGVPFDDGLPNVVTDIEFDESGSFITGSQSYDGGLSLKDAQHIVTFGDCEYFTLKSFGLSQSGYNNEYSAHGFWHDFKDVPFTGSIEDGSFQIVGIDPLLQPFVGYSDMRIENNLASGVAHYTPDYTDEECEINLEAAFAMIEKFCIDGGRFALTDEVL